ncbi:hypothetical protein BGZ61DRAFT_440367 [Ilyonectria robusta]|uniref:uncharacterized protein n=1 Tax=Ilyonectria robusta TaxID=1079257 RepID=UPI001E8DEFD0|nr:uncharacterized protein BGZ61DRAFT_440367 [Ilyonectria robusta]KAH8735496.1 hypothetical protein BGZ61DRAFT_440367 [Ilyonectria robusta]
MSAMPVMPAIIPRIAVLWSSVLAPPSLCVGQFSISRTTPHTRRRRQGFISSNYFACLGTEPIPAPLPLPCSR